VPRARTLAELAGELGVTEQAVSERLRRDLSALLASGASLERGGDSTDRGATDSD
jgi:predicted transcriptional regulator